MTTTARRLYDRWLETNDDGRTIEDVAMVELCHLDDEEWTDAVRGAEAIQAKREGREIRDSGWPAPTAECADCGNEYETIHLTDGVCDDCDNVRRGLCPCGRAIYEGFRECDECAAEERADALFHADR